MQYALIALFAACIALSLRWRWFAAPSVLVVALLFLAGLGSPVPSWIAEPTGRVAAFQLDHGKAIYLWVESVDGPVSYVLPWSEGQAQQLAEASQRAGKRGRVKVGKPTGEGVDGRPGGERRFEAEFYQEPAKEGQG